MSISKPIDTAESLKQAAKQEFVQKRYIAALDKYQKALCLQKDKQKRAIILLNIGLCFYHLNLMREYLDHVEKAIKENQKYVKAYYHKGKCLVLMGGVGEKQQTHQKQIKQCMEKLQEKDRKYLQNLSTKVNIARTKSYQYTQNWIQSLKTGSLEFQYFQQGIDIKKSQFGLGLFSNKNIPAYKIIIVQRPMVFLSKKEEIQMGNHVSDVTKIREKIKILMKMSSEFRNKFLGLCTKKNMNKDLKQRRLRQNISDKEIQQAVELNWFQAIDFVKDMKGQSEGQDLRIGSGLYQKISMINHQCQRNCQFLFVGEYMIIRTIKQIKPNEQIFISYKIQNDLFTRQMDLKSQWGINCTCLFCKQQGCQQSTKNISKKSPTSSQKSNQLQLHQFSSQIFFKKFDTASKYFVQQNPQLRWKKLLNLYNENQLKGKVVAKIFKDEGNVKKYVEMLKGSEEKNQGKYDMVNQLKRMMMNG